MGAKKRCSLPEDRAVGMMSHDVSEKYDDYRMPERWHLHSHAAEHYDRN